MSDSVRMLVLLTIVVVVLVVRQRAQWRRHVASVAEGLLRLRRLQGEDATYVPLGPGDAVAAGAQSAFDATTRDLQTQGCKLLGDCMEQRPSGQRLGPSRWFVSGDGAACGWFAVLVTPQGAQRPVMVIFSESSAPDYFTTTRGGASPSLAQPPNLTRQIVPWQDGFEPALRRHREIVAKARGPLTMVATLGDATALLQRLRVNTRTWRGSLAPAALLDPDVRSVLGKHYARMGDAVKQYLAAKA